MFDGSISTADVSSLVHDMVVIGIIAIVFGIMWVFAKRIINRKDK